MDGHMYFDPLCRITNKEKSERVSSRRRWVSRQECTPGVIENGPMTLAKDYWEKGVRHT